MKKLSFLYSHTSLEAGTFRKKKVRKNLKAGKK